MRITFLQTQINLGEKDDMKNLEDDFFLHGKHSPPTSNKRKHPVDNRKHMHTHIHSTAIWEVLKTISQPITV